MVPEPGRGRGVRPKKEVDKGDLLGAAQEADHAGDEQVPRVAGDEEVADLLGDDDYAWIQGSKPKKPPIMPVKSNPLRSRPSTTTTEAFK
jgi:hypothetical protein